MGTIHIEDFLRMKAALLSCKPKLNMLGSLIIDIPIDIDKNMHILSMKESSIILLGGKKKSNLKYHLQQVLNMILFLKKDQEEPHIQNRN